MGSTIVVNLPDIGDFDSVEIIDIAVSAGDSVDAGDTLISVESDKATMDIPAGSAGVIQELKVAVGDKISQDAAIALLVCETDSTSAPHSLTVEELPQDSSQVSAGAASTGDSKHKQAMTVSVQGQNVDASEFGSTVTFIQSGPSARRLARQLGIDIGAVTGSGKNGRISRLDVKNYGKSILLRANSDFSAENLGLDKPLPDLTRFGSVSYSDLSGIEKSTKKNMQRSWRLIPHAWLQQNIDITELETERQRLKKSVQGLTMTALIVKAVALGLQRFPRFNAALDSSTLQLVYREYVHIGVAVDTPRGLVIAVIRDANNLSIVDISDKLKHLGLTAREGRLTPAEMQGASMTISNLGGMGVSGMQPIVNWPEVAILGVSSSGTQPVYVGSELQPRIIMPITLGFDHRVINGADGARFIGYINELLQDPVKFLIQL